MNGARTEPPHLESKGLQVIQFSDQRVFREIQQVRDEIACAALQRVSRLRQAPPPTPPREGGEPDGFTLVELLVVVAIIVVLLSLLGPSMDKAMSQTQLLRCLSNQHAIGQGLALYFADHRQRYPMMNIWWDLLGDAGNGNYEDVTKRPLNAYLGYTSDGSKVPVARCPSDIGDPGTDDNPATYIENVYKLAGTSYVQPWHMFPNEPNGIAATKLVFGYTGGLDMANATKTPTAQYAQYNTAWTSVKQTSLTRTDNKAVNMDWPWHPNRQTYEERLRWHRPELEERIFSTLFADGHADLLNMDKYVVDLKYGGGPTAYSTSREWW